MIADEEVTEGEQHGKGCMQHLLVHVSAAQPLERSGRRAERGQQL